MPVSTKGLTAVNQCTSYVLAKLDMILAAMPPTETGANHQQFVTCVVKECNALSAASIYDTKTRGNRALTLSEPATCISCVSSVFRCAAMGLPPGDAFKFCFLVPKTSKSGPDIIQVYMGYPGYIELGYASGYLADCSSGYVLAGETWRHWHDDDGEHITHEMPPVRELSRENLVAAYCTWHTRYQTRGLVVVPKSDIARVDTGRDIWLEHYAAMVCKTAIIRGSKTWRRTRELVMAQTLDESFDNDIQQSPIDQLKEPTEVIDLDSF